jgi:hypothetical protein
MKTSESYPGELDVPAGDDRSHTCAATGLADWNGGQVSVIEKV